MTDRGRFMKNFRLTLFATLSRTTRTTEIQSCLYYVHRQVCCDKMSSIAIYQKLQVLAGNRFSTSQQQLPPLSIHKSEKVSGFDQIATVSPFTFVFTLRDISVLYVALAEATRFDFCIALILFHTLDLIMDQKTDLHGYNCITNINK